MNGEPEFCPGYLGTMLALERQGVRRLTKDEREAIDRLCAPNSILSDLEFVSSGKSQESRPYDTLPADLERATECEPIGAVAAIVAVCACAILVIGLGLGVLQWLGGL